MTFTIWGIVWDSLTGMTPARGHRRPGGTGLSILISTTGCSLRPRSDLIEARYTCEGILRLTCLNRGKLIIYSGEVSCSIRINRCISRYESLYSK
jgi:hypothetical protein